MRILVYLTLILTTISCKHQVDSVNKSILAISPTVDQNNNESVEIILVLKEFLKTKNLSLTENKYWLKSDFSKYIHPYQDIYQIEKSKYGDNYFM